MDQVWTVDEMKERPAELLDLLGRQVQVDLRKGQPVVGYLHTFDPLSGTLVLLRFQPTPQPPQPVDRTKQPTQATRRDTPAERLQVQLLSSHAFRQLRSVPGAAEEMSDRQRELVELLFMHRGRDAHAPGDGGAAADAELQLKKERIVRCLRANLIPVEEQPDGLLIAHQLRLRPPFRRDDCECSNEIVLQRTLDLLKEEL